ncbi:MAG: hypothetical protein AAFU80_02575 [Pseudomonadota bacterium]
MQIEQIFSSIFHVVEVDGDAVCDVAFEVPFEDGVRTVRLSLVSHDRHAADTMAHMFNRVVNGVTGE